MTYAALPVLWDLDGTLVDSAADIAAAVDRALEAHGYAPLGPERVRKHIGSGAQNLVTRCVEEAGGAMTPALLESFFTSYLANVAVHTQLYPGLGGLLDALADRGVPQAIVTNKPVDITVALLDALGLTRYFPVVYGGESLPKRKPHPMMLHAAMADLGVDRAVMVGDGPHDVGAGRAAGLPVIGVNWGIAKPDGADVRVDTVAELTALLIPEP